MMATPAATLPTGQEWTYEVKWDGYRALGQKRGHNVSLRSRNQKDFTKQYPSVVAALKTVAADRALIDGEIVALDGEGRPSFQALQHSTAAHAIVFYAFDLLHLDGRDLLREPLETRRELLAGVVRGSQVLLSTPLPGSPQQIIAAVKRLGLEGVVAKRRGSVYESGRRSRSWIKVRFSLRQELVIGGYVAEGPTFDSIVVGYFDGDRRLLSAGKVRAGFTPAVRAAVHARLVRMHARRCPFVNLPNSRTSHWGEGISAEDMAAITWVRPELVAEIAFTEWTRDGSLRHAAFVAVRDDKPAREVRRET
jgi:bifunctional non-homologous end joining protein LigD